MKKPNGSINWTKMHLLIAIGIFLAEDVNVKYARGEKMTGKRIGYIRVSTFEQNPDRQLVDIQLDKKFIEYASASSMDRPQLKLMLEFVREDDIIFVHSMDRLARNTSNLLEIVKTVIEKKAEIHFSKEQLTFNGSTNAMSMLLLHIMGAIAEFELCFNKERQREGIAEAKAKGKYKGGKRKLDAEKIEILRKEMQGRDSKLKIARKLGITPMTLYKYLKEYNIS